PVVVDPANATVARIGDQEIVARINRDIPRLPQLRLGCGTAVAAESARALAGDGADDAAGIDLADLVMGQFGEVVVAFGVERDLAWNGDRRLRRRPAVP